MGTFPRETKQISRSIMMPGHAPAFRQFNYRMALSLRDLAASTTGYPKYLLAPEVAVLLDAVTDLRKRMLFDLVWNTGARINEALAVTPRDIVLDAVRPFVVLHTLKQRMNPRPGRPRKNEPVKRAVPLLDAAFVARLRDHLATFTKHDTKPLWDVTDDTARNWMSQAVSECNRRGMRFSIPDVTPKTLRHSFAMHLAMNGSMPLTLQAYMGHRDFKSTQEYLRIFALDVEAGQPSGISFSYPADIARLTGDNVTIGSDILSPD
ncbi:tyrosine-type recombinase/integrase [Scandinavium goeteborgense]|uniref:Phage integrase family protein n=1 Tax=Scandinavium goeteborgense TaxID=1851514 RepID=A0A4R6DSF8_SCAGO|nr:tyrosine-type recombinase/integrase [Scandinavium goeteborgense]TDN48051.1 phage integrase family protein [Scandinavium goeteborgense]